METTPGSTYTARLRALADFLDNHPEIPGRRVHVSPDGPTFHLDIIAPDWHANAQAVTSTFGPAVHEQTHAEMLVLRIDDSPVGRITLFIPRWADRPLTDRGPEVALDGLVSA